MGLEESHYDEVTRKEEGDDQHFMDPPEGKDPNIESETLGGTTKYLYGFCGKFITEFNK